MPKWPNSAMTSQYSCGHILGDSVFALDEFSYRLIIGPTQKFNDTDNHGQKMITCESQNHFSRSTIPNPKERLESKKVESKEPLALFVQAFPLLAILTQNQNFKGYLFSFRFLPYAVKRMEA